MGFRELRNFRRLRSFEYSYFCYIFSLAVYIKWKNYMEIMAHPMTQYMSYGEYFQYPEYLLARTYGTMIRFIIQGNGGQTSLSSGGV